MVAETSVVLILLDLYIVPITDTTLQLQIFIICVSISIGCFKIYKLKPLVVIRCDCNYLISIVII